MENRFFSVELVGWNKQHGIFDFNIYRRDTETGNVGDDVVASFDVQNKQVYAYSLFEELGVKTDPWETMKEAAETAERERLFELVLDYYICNLIQKASSFDAIWESLAPMNREDLSLIQEEALVNKCYEIYEKEGFAKTFHTPYSEKEYNGMPFKVLKRISTKDERFDIESLPMWRIKFPDESVLEAFPEEIIASEQQNS